MAATHRIPLTLRMEGLPPEEVIFGRSAIMQEFRRKVQKFASTSVPLLIQGESGTGKGVLARYIHSRSSVAAGPFVNVNCAAIPGTLLESELFGYEKGAFTGAVSQTIGRFQSADRGTLFLDEIGDLPLELQPKLLRALQEKQFERLGGGHTLQVDVRVIAATNQNLGRLVQERKFRADLFYRLNVFPMMLPPLRERREDIRPLVEHFVEKFARQQGKTIHAIPEHVIGALEDYSWPGNIRELQNVIERGVIVTTGSTLSHETVEPLIWADVTREDEAPLQHRAIPVRTLADAERDHITRTLRETKWVIGGPHGAAAQLGLPRTTLIARMHRLGISSAALRSMRPAAGTVRAMEAVAG